MFRGSIVFISSPGSSLCLQARSLNFSQSRLNLLASYLFFSVRNPRLLDKFLVFFLCFRLSFIVFLGLGGMSLRAGSLMSPDQRVSHMRAPLPILVSVEVSSIVYPSLLLRLVG